MKYFLNENTFTIDNISAAYEIIKNIHLEDENSLEKITISSDNISQCKELFTAFKTSKKVKQITIKILSNTFQIEATLKTNPLRISSIKAPNPLGEDISDNVLERVLYLKFVYKFFENELISFAKIRTRDSWITLIESFRDFLSSLKN
ncbi:hypothetical protein FHQ18_05885 [Deferribacter autotrophicus]|uniref:Uncharacterized protein n=1 Tax=Deferribacter autotrophicus TaxID=500465 RepID=A0A5A8F5F5_9BACT|nr:hypothetical protein [Deferribacter autotrophicus]KAA0258686.1 hypothetical protein FHQ18_05885 [Deferribacter autotrophicus]